MRPPSVCFIACLIALFHLALFACKSKVNPCVQSLAERDAALLHHADSLMLGRAAMPLETYRDALEQLRTQEQQLFQAANDCDFGKDLQAYNYWHRGRLKFPSKIEQEWQRLEHAPIGK
ncbi:MAG: hypothetical protein KF734_22895 [Saprospiraceae bacterium]|nr:hypothetical protein [Saprospiraceae bacterium]